MKFLTFVFVIGVLLVAVFLKPSTQDCIVGPDLAPVPLSNVGSYLQIFTSIRFPCSGKIVRWSYFSRAVGTPVYFGVWEAINATTFRLVDYNRVVPNATGLIHEDILDPSEFVGVTPGLYLGIHYDSIDIPQDRQVVPYADAVKPDPYNILQLSDGFPVGVGHHQIVGSNGLITFTGILFKQWRLPALQASVKFLIDCGKPPVIPNSKVTFKTTLAFSTSVYQCNSGYRLIGNPMSTCQSSGLWSAPPICDINDLCFAGPELYDNPLESASSLLQLFPSLQFQCAGFLGRWWFYSRSPSRIVYLSVWRQVPGENAVKMVGANRILAAHRGLNYFRVPEDDMIFVDPGDFIGIFYDRPDLAMSDVVVPYAAEHALNPYLSPDLSETLLLPMGQIDISVSNGQIDLTQHADGAIAYWRIPAFRGYVINRQQNSPMEKGVPVCPQPPLVAYATTAFSSTKVGSVAVYSCVQGYTLYGQNPIKCLNNQKWSGVPECRLIPRCEEPPQVPLAIAYFNSTSVGAQVNYYCKTGYLLMGPNPLTCQTNLSWTQPLPYCLPSSACPAPPVIINGQLSMTGTLTPKGAVAFYTCSPGFVMVGASSVFCTDDRTWSAAPICAPAMPLQPVKNMAVPMAGPTGPHGSWDKLTRPVTPAYRTKWQTKWQQRTTQQPEHEFYPSEHPTEKTTERVLWVTSADTTTESTTSFVSFNVPSFDSTLATEAVTSPLPEPETPPTPETLTEQQTHAMPIDTPESALPTMDAGTIAPDANNLDTEPPPRSPCSPCGSRTTTTPNSQDDVPDESQFLNDLEHNEETTTSQIPCHHQRPPCRPKTTTTLPPESETTHPPCHHNLDNNKPPGQRPPCRPKTTPQPVIIEDNTEKPCHHNIGQPGGQRPPCRPKTTTQPTIEDTTEKPCHHNTGHPGGQRPPCRPKTTTQPSIEDTTEKPCHHITVRPGGPRLPCRPKTTPQPNTEKPCHHNTGQVGGQHPPCRPKTTPPPRIGQKPGCHQRNGTGPCRVGQNFGQNDEDWQRDQGINRANNEQGEVDLINGHQTGGQQTNSQQSSQQVDGAQGPVSNQQSDSNEIDLQTTSDEGVVHVLSAEAGTDYIQSILPAVVVPILVIFLIVIFATAFAWHRHKRARANKAEAIGYAGRSFYENVRNGMSGSMATGYAHGSHSEDGYEGNVGNGNYSLKTEDDLSSEEMAPVASSFDMLKHQPNFFVAGVGPSPMHQSAGAFVSPPPPPPPLPPPPAYFGHSGTMPRSGPVLAYNNSYYTKSGASTLKRNR